jgi:hypothetical protein
LTSLRNLSEVLSGTLKHSAWIAVLDESEAKQAKDYAKKYAQIGQVVAALVGSESSQPRVQLSFRPPKEGAEADIIRVYRQAFLSMGGNPPSGWLELARYIGQPSYPIFKDLPTFLKDDLKIAFRKLSNDTSLQYLVNEPDWALVRLIKSRQAQSEDGILWIVTVPLNDASQGISGKAVFEIKTSQPLPKVDDWPQK